MAGPYLTTIAIDGTNYLFQGFFAHTPLYEKNWPLTNYWGNLNLTGTGGKNDLVDTYLSPYFVGMRIMGMGGEQFRDNSTVGANLIPNVNTDTLAYPSFAQASGLAYINQRVCANGYAPLQYIYTPFTSPGTSLHEGWGKTCYPNLAQIASTDSTTATTSQAFAADNATVWQAAYNATADSIIKYENQGCNFNYITGLNEFTVTSVANWWLTNISVAQTVEDYYDYVFLGKNGVTPGLLNRFPNMQFIAPGSSTTAQLSSAALAKAVYYDSHDYPTSATGMGTSTAQQYFGTTQAGKIAMTEFGTFANAPFTTAMCGWYTSFIQNSIVYGLVPLIAQWTIMRDVTAKKIPNPNGVTYTGVPLLNLTTSSGTFAPTLFWYALYGFLKAVGRGTSNILCTSITTAANSNTTWNPGGSGVEYAKIHVHRTGTDGKQATLIYNFSGGAITETITYTQGGVGYNMTGTLTDIDMTGSGVINTPTAILTSGGAYVVSSMPSGHCYLLEWSYP